MPEAGPTHHPAEPDAAGSLAALEGCFDAATASAGVVEHDLCIAGHLIRLRFAGPALVPAVVPALSHLAVDPTEGDEPVLTVGLWDSDSTATPPVPVPAVAATASESGPRYHSEAEGLVLDSVDSTLTVLDRARGFALHHVRGPDTYQWYQRASPLKELLHAWAAGAGLHFVHAAAVGQDGAGVLLTGTSGAGKSTTSLACVAGGLDFAGDDYVLVDPDALTVHSLYRSARLGWPTLERFSGLLVPDNAPPDEKALAFLDTGVVTGFTLAAVLVPRLAAGAGTTVVAASRAQALLALAPSTVLQLPGGHAAALQAARRILEAVPAHSLLLGTDLTGVAVAVRDLLADR